MTHSVFEPVQPELFDAPVVEAWCDEPDGPVQRLIYPLRLTMQNLQTFWEKSNKFRTLFTDDINGDFKKFAELFLSLDASGLHANGLFWVMDDFVGVFYMTDIKNNDAEVHFTFFDRRLTGREDITRRMLVYVFKRFLFHRLTVEIPKYASRHTFAFVERIGFIKEGERRSAAYYKEAWFDVVTYGLLHEEVL